MDENRGATQARGIPVQVTGEVGPREFSLNQILFLAADFDVRPCPIKTAMIHVIRGKVVGSYRIESLRYRTGPYL